MHKLSRFLSSTFQFYDLKQTQKSGLEEPLLARQYEGGEDDPEKNKSKESSCLPDEDDRDLVDKVDCLGRLADSCKDKIYGVVKIETLLHKGAKFVDPTNKDSFFEFKDGKVYDENGELEEVEIDEDKRTITGKLSRYGF